jgi:hypothetical protein
MTFLSDNPRIQRDRVPQDPANPEEVVFRDFFYVGEQIRFNIRGGMFTDQWYPPGGASGFPPETYWQYAPVTGGVKLYDLTSIPERMGEVTDANITKPPGGYIGTPWIYDGPTLGAGLYCLRMQRATEDPYWWKDQGAVQFAVVRQHPNIPRPPVDTTHAGLFGGIDVALNGFLGRAAGMERMHLDVPPASGDSVSKVRADSAWNQSTIDHYNAFVKDKDPARKTRLFCPIRSGTGVGSAIAAGIRKAVQAYPEVDVWMWRNEPFPNGGSGGGNAGAWYKPEMKQFCDAVHAASSTAMAGGTDSTDGGTPGSIEQCRQFFAPNSTNNYNNATLLDSMSEHYYPYARGNWHQNRRMYQRRNELYRDFNVHAKLKVNSEAGSVVTDETGIANIIKQGCEGICDLLAFEQMGRSVPGSSDGCMENWLYYHTVAHGDPFRSFLQAGPHVSALELLLYNHGYELYGCPNGNGYSNISHVLNFGTREMYLGGHVYNRRANGTGVAVFGNFGPRRTTVRARLTGSSIPSSLTFATGWGLEGTVPVETVGSDKFITLTVGHPDPVYLRLPPGVNNEIEVMDPSDRGTKVAIKGVTFNGPTFASQSISNLVRGPLQDAWAYGSDNSGQFWHAWEAAANLLPDANNRITLALPNFQIVKQIVIQGLMQHQSECQILKAHLEFRDAQGHWTRAGDEIDEDYEALKWASIVHDARQVVISGHPRAWELNVPDITADAVRLVVEKTTYGGTQTAEGLNGYGINPTYYPNEGNHFYGGVAAYQGAGQRIYLQRIELFGVTAPGQPGSGGGVRALFRKPDAE